MYTFYLTSRSLVATPYNTYKKWEDIFDFPIPWEQVFNLMFRTTVDTFLRSFQLKIIYNFSSTRKMLKIWGIAESDICRFCLMESESTVHLFWYCHVVSLFWREVQRMCTAMKLSFSCDSFSVILGDVTETSSYIINLIILLGKRFIFNAVDADSLNINQFKMLIKRYFVLEGYIANRNGDVGRYLERWERFIELEGWHLT